MDKMNFNEYKAFVYELLSHMKDSDTDKIELEFDSAKIKLVRRITKTSIVTPTAPTQLSAQPMKDIENEPIQKSFKAIKSPLVGIAYLSPSPEAAPFVKIGSTIQKGEVICIIEAMKVMNEIEADSDGIVEDILFKSGDAVEYGQPLIRLK